jgi:hypothetical protein
MDRVIPEFKINFDKRMIDKLALIDVQKRR